MLLDNPDENALWVLNVCGGTLPDPFQKEHDASRDSITFLGVVTAKDYLFVVELSSHKHKENKGNAARKRAVRETLHAYN
jgi:hypothetical protein